MDQEKPSGRLVEGWLERLNLAELADWDVLVFLYRHRTSLASADQIARLVGYTSGVVADALDQLESRKLVKRSRASQGVHLYQFSDSTDPDDSFHQLVKLTQSRSGRLLVIKKLRKCARRESHDRLHLMAERSANGGK